MAGLPGATSRCSNLRPISSSKTLRADDINHVTRERSARRTRGTAEMVVRGFAALGVLGGFFWGWHHEVHPTCSNHGTAALALNRCTSTALSSIATHWGLALGGGVAIGSAISVLLAVTLARRLAQQ